MVDFELDQTDYDSLSVILFESNETLHDNSDVKTVDRTI